MSITLLKDQNNQNLSSGVIAIHAALVPTATGGAAIAYFGTPEQAWIYDLDALDQAPVQLGTEPGQWAFCSGHAFLGDGRWVIAGGVAISLLNQDLTHHMFKHDSGEHRCEIYSPLAGTFEPIAPLNFQPGADHGGGRWYPTAVTVANGDVFCAAGHPFAGIKYPNPDWDENQEDPNNPPQFLEDLEGQDDYVFGSDPGARHNNNTPERYMPGRDEWIQLVNESTSNNNLGVDEYPRLHLDPSGHVFFATIAKGKKRFYNPFTGAYDGTQVEPGDSAYHYGSEPTSVLLPILPRDLQQVWVLNCGRASAQKINIAAGSPAWETAGTPPLGKSRAHACSVLLPTGSVFLNAGEVQGGPDTPASELYHPPINWNELTYESGPGTWEEIDTPLIKRGYHSVALLMPDGRVWIAGSTWSDWSQNGVQMEVYTPPYFVPGRVAITEAPPSIGYDGVINVRLSSNKTITRAVLIRCGSVTHAFDSDQRYVVCQFQQSGTNVQVRAPMGPGIAPPGHYMLFLLDNVLIEGHGRPCVKAPILRLCDQACVPVPNISKYSKLTVDALKNGGNTATFADAIWLFLENFRAHEANFPNEPTVSLRWDSPGGPTVNPSLFKLLWQNPWPENNTLPPDIAQRFALRYNVRVHVNIYDDVNVTRNLFVIWDFGNFTCSTMLEVTTKPNPFMVDVKGGNPHWLSTDLRVFSVRAGANPPAGAPALGTNESPFDYLQKALATYNDAGNAVDNPFDDLDAGQDTSALELRKKIGDAAVYNFAIARVRYIAQGQNVNKLRVFFRMFNTVGTALEYDTGTTYRRKGDGPDAVPLLGREGNQLISIPFHDKPRVTPNQATTKQPPDEARDLLAQGAAEYTRYFGAWFDINQDSDERIPPLYWDDGPFLNPLPPFKPVSIKEVVRGYHQCLVAEVHHVDDPIPDINSPQAGTPANNDNLSQRNLAWVPVGNPGSVATRTAQTTFMARPSGTLASDAYIPPKIVPRGQILTVAGAATSVAGAGRIRLMPDELVFDGSYVPDGTRVTVYWPDVNFDEVIALAERRSSPVRLERVDEHTVAFELHGAAYLPLPGGRTAPIPGLLSAELPAGIAAGERYRLIVHQFSGKKRRVIGTFQLEIPVAHEPDLLVGESIKLSLLRWIGARIPPADVWYPVFLRYLGEIERRVTGFGGDPDAIEPDADGNGYPGADRPDREKDHLADGRRGRTVEGKVAEVRYDCFGDFAGFVLMSCEKRYTFDSRECGVEQLVLRACRERLRLVVTICPDDPFRLLEVGILCG
jgi:hypothetical protein